MYRDDIGRDSFKFFQKQAQTKMEGMSKEEEEKRLLANKLFQSAMEGIMITDTRGLIKLINPAFSRITGYGEEVIGLNPRVLKSGKHGKAFYEQIWNSVEKKGQWKGEIWNRRQNGELYVQWTTITVIRDDHGSAIYYAGVFTDITKRKKEEEKLRNDLLLAREIQKGLLTRPIHDKYIHIEAIYFPSIQLGGDMYVWYKIDDHRYGIFLMDVMGHGVASALVCVSLRSLLEGIITRCVSPEKVINELNRQVNALFSHDNFDSKKYYLTGFYVVVDTYKKSIHYASAGHPPGFLIDESGHTKELNIGSIPIGMMDEIEVQTGIVDYSGETKLVLYTDGMIENEDCTTRENIENLKNTILKNRKMEANELLSEVVSSFLNRDGTLKFHDDAAMIVATIF